LHHHRSGEARDEEVSGRPADPESFKPADRRTVEHSCEALCTGNAEDDDTADLVPSDMIAVPVAPQRSFAVVASPTYFEANGEPRVPSDLLRHACLRIRLPNGALHRWQFQKDGEFQIDVDGPMKLDEASMARIAVLEHVGIGYLMESDVGEDIEAGRLVRVLRDWTPSLARLSLYYPSRRNPSAAFKALIDMAREVG
jgi:DNA-binding transcriptional LysR family regulator